MTLPRQKKNESDADYAIRLEAFKERRREYYRKWREANREAAREHNRKWREANRDYNRRWREANKGYDRKWREANREAVREHDRKYREANKEALREYNRKWREANRDALKEYARKWREASTLANAKGKPLRSDCRRSQRPKVLTMLILKVAEDFCRDNGFPLESKFDSDVLRHAAKTIRNSPELDGAANPWYGTDYLCPGAVDTKDWVYCIRKRWRNKT